MSECQPLAKFSMRLVNNWASLLTLLLLVFLPVYGPFMTTIEGQLWPVTSKVDIIEERSADDGTGMLVRFAYTKYRACELIGTTMTIGTQEIGFAPVAGSNPPVTRSPGRQISRLWHADTPTLEDVSLWFLHRCHIFWYTVTQVMP